MKPLRKKVTKSSKKSMPRSKAHRLRSARKVLAGFSAADVGDMYGDSPRAVAYWVTRFKAHGAVGLEVLPRSGRPSKLSPAQLAEIREYIEKTARTGEITGSSLAAFIKETFGIKLSRQHSRRILIKLGV